MLRVAAPGFKWQQLAESSKDREPPVADGEDSWENDALEISSEYVDDKKGVIDISIDPEKSLNI